MYCFNVVYFKFNTYTQYRKRVSNRIENQFWTECQKKYTLQARSEIKKLIKNVFS